MSSESPILQLRRAAELSLIALVVAGCSNTNVTPAPISSVDSRSGQGSDSGMLVSAPPAVKSVVQTPSVQSAKKESPSIETSSVQSVAVKSAQTENGRIVYNRQYGNIPKGSYTGGSTYRVKRGDTLFYIAWITGNDFRDLAQRNNVAAPYGISVGQTLQVGNAVGRPLTPGNSVSATDASAQGGAVKIAANSGMVVASQPTITYPDNSIEQSANKMLPANKGVGATVTAPANLPVVSTIAEPIASSQTASSPISSWRWPTEGKIIESFSSSEGGNRAIDIAGLKGQAIDATASGRVVYAGSALRGYGNLIIIKHSDDYLSAYAHNDTMLVREQQEVKAGQKIATMGSTGTSSTRLHFEIRYKGKSVNPLQYLPQR